MNSKTLEQRLNKHIIKQPNGCWLWNSSHTKNSAVIHNPGGTRCVKKILYKKYNPNKKVGSYLTNSCKNLRCISPNHLLNRSDYFESLIFKNPENDCWEWRGEIKGGYGTFNIKRKPKLVHRIMYERYKGKIPPKINVCHSCDNPSCVNPDHLWLGSQMENVTDMMQKGRGNKARGVEHHNCKITEQEVRDIKKMYNEGIKMTVIHRSLNVPYKTVQHICYGSSWRHVKI
jgi:hypothetical protein